MATRRYSAYECDRGPRLSLSPAILKEGAGADAARQGLHYAIILNFVLAMAQALSRGLLRGRGRFAGFSARGVCAGRILTGQRLFAFALEPFEIFALDLLDPRLFSGGIDVDGGKTLGARRFDQLAESHRRSFRAILVSGLDDRKSVG